VNHAMTYGIKAPFNWGYKEILLVINKWLNVALAPIESGLDAKSHISLNPIECASNAAPKTPSTMSLSKGWLSRAKASTSAARTESVGWGTLCPPIRRNCKSVFARFVGGSAAPILRATAFMINVSARYDRL
jgi:hypothetical protein